jgi:simple sugar transport system permease protein
MAVSTTAADQAEAADRISIGSRLAQGARALGVPLGSVLFAFLGGGVIVAVTGGDPVHAYQDLICGGLGIGCTSNVTALYQISETIAAATPLILTGLAVAIAFRAGLFNIGAEGQFIMGIIMATVLGLKFSTWPAFILLPMVLIGGTLAGALWGGIAGVLKATTGAHEVVTTIMLNYVALWMTRALIVGGPLQSPNRPSSTESVGAGAQLPHLIPATLTISGLPGSAYRAHAGVVLAVLAAIVFWFLIRRTALGYEIRAIGQSQRAARFAGISVPQTIIVTMLISGAFAGLAGAIQIAGFQHYMSDIYFSDTTGFDAIAVSLLGQNTAIGVVLAAGLLGSLHVGGAIMQFDAGISSRLVDILEALILFSLAANILRTFKLRLPTPGRQPGAGTEQLQIETAISEEEQQDVIGGAGTTAQTYLGPPGSPEGPVQPAGGGQLI